MQHAPFVHLHLHTQYSLLDAAIRIDELMRQAQAQRMPAVAMTDHGNLFGAIEFYHKAVKAGIKPIVGCEVYVAPGSRFERNAHGIAEASYHLILLARDRTGYKNLIKLVSEAHLTGFYYRPRIDKELLAQHAEGLIGLTACLGGEVPSLLARQRWDDAREAAATYRDILGAENFYLELQDNGVAEQPAVNRELVRLGRDLGIPLVATNDCHYLRREDARAHDALLCIGTGKAVTDPQRRRYPGDQFFFKSAEEMHERFRELPEALRNTLRIAERCNLVLDFDAVHLPEYTVPEGTTREAYLGQLARQGLEQRLRESPVAGRIDPQRYWQRLEEELRIIASMGFAGYFLIVWDFIRYARERRIPVGPGRGSAAGSLVAYALRITDVDPLAYGLLFERFLNPERVSLPDIDIDFCMDRRDEVIRYVTQKYGADRVCQIITFGSMAARAVIRDVGRVLNIPYGEVDRVAKLVPPAPNMTLREALELEPRLQELVDSDSRIKELFETAFVLEGLSRHASTHAAGVVISREPLTEHVPLYKGTRGEIVTQYAKDDLERIGLVKFDFLGLRTLTVIDHTVTLINRARGAGTPFRIDAIPMDDAKTFALLGTGRTTGIFQLESAGMRDLLIKMKPSTFEDIIALVALYRPGPLQSGMVDDYIKRKRGATAITYLLPQLEPILRETYGVILYQEQVMQIANVLAGFSMGEADILRKAMGKKLPEVMERQKQRFVDGCTARGIDAHKAEALFELMAKFAEYGFNKSHSAAYALIAYQTAYLKAHHPVEFMAALLTSEMEHTDKVARYLAECKEMGIDVLPPDVNESQKDFTPVPVAGEAEALGCIRFGLAAVKNVGESAIEAILSAREAHGRFTSLEDFCRKVDLRRVNRRVLESLIKCGALDSLGGHRAQLLRAMDRAMEGAGQIQKDRATGQTSFFQDLAADSGGPSEPFLPDVPPWSEHELLAYEKEMLGFYISGHPLARFGNALRKYATASTLSLQDMPDGREVTLCGLVGAVRERTTKKRGEKMATVLVEDLQGTVEVLVFPDLYRTGAPLLNTDEPLVVTGVLDKSENGVKLKATRLELLSQVRQRTTSRVGITIHSTGTTAEDLEQLRDILLRHQGSCPVILRLRIPNRSEVHIEVGAADDQPLRVNPTDPMVHEVEALLGEGTVSLEVSG